ncbi:YraN family protein [Actinokineospora enzanensis]|uniref:YraN family protein n=1 Tax=Actinokineospora enzanensis TaxID=155975 RepID=UPI0003754F59|nr:YraN family protein [Actinokineospora enzanensis]
MSTHLRLGAHGEDLAARHLERTGHVILARNWRCELGELDIVCARDGHLVVCEVKTRSSTDRGTPAEAVTPAKAQRIHLLTDRWRRDNGVGPRPTRFDIVAVLVPGTGAAEIRHLRGVF